MASMNISLPDELREYVEACIAEDGYSTASEYFRELVRRDQTRKAQAELEAKLLERLSRGRSAPLTRKDWDYIRSTLYGRLAAEGKA
jgi:antitoxin ParD1/3/4